MTSAAVRPAARNSRTPVSPEAFESLVPSGRRMSGWWWNTGGRSRPRSRPSRICEARRLEQVAAPDDEVDPLAQVVDDDTEAIGPIALAVADGQVARGGHVARTRPDDPIHPGFLSAAERDPKDRPGQAADRTRARTAGSGPQPLGLLRPRVERRPGAVAAVDEALGLERRQRVAVRRVIVRLAHRPEIRPEPEPLEVLEERRVVLGPAALPVVVLDPQQHPAARRPRRCPTPRRRWRRARGAGSRSGRARSGSAARRRDQAPSGPSSRDRSCASSARVAAISRR